MYKIDHSFILSIFESQEEPISISKLTSLLPRNWYKYYSYQAIREKILYLARKEKLCVIKSKTGHRIFFCVPALLDQKETVNGPE
jgi:hypothetical protein